MKNFADCFKPVQMSPDRLSEVEGVLSESSRLIKEHIESSGFKKRADFFAALLATKSGKCRRVGSAVVEESVALRILAVKEVEVELLGHFSLMIQKAIYKHSLKFGRDPSDFQSVAYEIFVNVMLNFDGRCQFSTYLYHSLGRSLKRSIPNERLIRVPSQVRKLSMRIFESMNSKGLTFDEAVECVGAKKKDISRVVAGMSPVKYAADMEMDDSEMAFTNDSENTSWIMDVVDRAGLGKLEREAVRILMNSPAGSMGFAKGCRSLINPSTGRPYSSSAMSAAWKQAKKKIAMAMGEAA